MSNFFVRLGIMYHQCIRTVVEDICVDIIKDIRHVTEFSWDNFTAPLQFLQWQKLQCALKLLKKTEEDPFLCQPIPINNTIETHKHYIEEEKLHSEYKYIQYIPVLSHGRWNNSSLPTLGKIFKGFIDNIIIYICCLSLKIKMVN